MWWKLLKSRAALFLAVIVVLLLVVIWYASSRHERYLSGFWNIDPSFASQAGIGDMVVYIGEKDGNTRPGYVYMTDTKGNSIANQAFEVSDKFSKMVRKPWSALKTTFGDDVYRFGANFDFDEDFTGPGAMADQMDIALSMVNGTLTLYDSEKIYGHFHRDNATSAST
jgi:hypothetical protein